MAEPITTVLFDFDGTLANTNELIISTFTHVLEENYPGRFNRQDILTFLGPTLYETFSSIDKERTEELIAQYQAWNQAHHDDYVTAFPGVVEGLRLLKERGVKLAVVSTKKRGMVQRGMDLLGIADCFETMIGLEDVKNPKPDPEPLELALQRLGSSADEALMVGDNFHDILGGQNAGVRTAAVAWAIKGEEYLMTFKPDYMLHSMSDLFALLEGNEQ